MSRLGKKVLSVSVLLATLAVSANAFTVATFADPAPNSATPLFTLAGTTFSGSWTNPGLTLQLPATAGLYPNAKFTMSNLTLLNAGGLLSGGTIWFVDALNNPIMQISFQQAHLYNPFGWGASQFLADGVSFSGPALASLPPLQDQNFAFSFANPMTYPDRTTWTAAFTSSATPEPASLGLVLAGLLFGLRRR